MVTVGRRQRHLECTLHLVTDRAGNLTAVWIEGLISSERLMGSHYDAARGAWTVPAQLDDWVNNISQLDVVTDSAGAVTVAYAQGGFDSRARVVRWEAASGQCGTFKNLDPATAGLDSRAPPWPWTRPAPWPPCGDHRTARVGRATPLRHAPGQLPG